MGLVLEGYAPSPIDMLKVTKLLLVHDLVEIDAGDTFLYQEDQHSKLEEETKAAKRIFFLLPETQAKEYLNLWLEFEDQSSKEAKFASVMDGIQPLLNHVITGDPIDGVIAIDKVRQKKKYIQRYSPRLWPLVEELIEKGEKLGLYA